jgi:hypothetical protein
MASPPPTNPATATSKPKIKNIPNPRRLLILTPTSQSVSIIPPLLHSLTGVPVLNPPPQTTATDSTQPSGQTTFAGYTTHSPLRLETKYYTTEVPIWVDEIPLSDSETATDTPASQWKADFLSSEAEIVREAVGALVVCVHVLDNSSPPPEQKDRGNLAERGDVPSLRDLMRGVGAVKERIDEERGGVGDVPGIFVLVGARKGASGLKADDESGLGNDLGEAVPLSVGWWEDQLYDMGLVGWEVVDWDPKEGCEVETRNHYGGSLIDRSVLVWIWLILIEREGMPRIKEVLETHDWSMTGSSGLDGESDIDSEDGLEDQLLGMSGSRGFGDEVHELEREMFGLRMAIERGGGGDEEEEAGHDDGDDELEIETMEALMMRMQAIKGMPFSDLVGSHFSMVY